MEILFSPWRSSYVTAAKEEGEKCILCRIHDSKDDELNLVLSRSPLHFVLINRYPYNTGHIMVVANRHAPSLHGLTPEERSELIRIAARAEKILSDVYGAQGINMGINIGAAAGAGIQGHLHMHLLPRWTGDTNFMSVVGETRVIPEDLSRTYARLKPLFDERLEGREAP